MRFGDLKKFHRTFWKIVTFTSKIQPIRPIWKHVFALFWSAIKKSQFNSNFLQVFEILVSNRYEKGFQVLKIVSQVFQAIIKPTGHFLQVNLCQKLLFLHQLTHNMTTDCSLNYKFNTWKFQAQTWGENVVYRSCFWHSEQFLYTTCSPHVLQKAELLIKVYLHLCICFSLTTEIKIVFNI